MRQRRETPFEDDVHSEDALSVVDENIFVNSPSALRTPRSHDTALRDITDQFFHPPSPSPVRISARTVDLPRRPKKPKSLAYPADPPNWIYSPSPSLYPDAILHATPVRRSCHPSTPSRASDSDPFGFVALERALKVKRAAPALPPRSTLKSPPRSTVLPSAPVFTSFSQIDAPVPTNNEDIDDLYADEPVAGPSRVHIPAAPLLLMNSDRPFGKTEVTLRSTSPDPLYTPRKRKHRADADPDPDEEGSDVPSSPSPVKVSVRAGTHAQRHPGTTRSSRTPVLKPTRAQTRTAGTGTRKPLPTTPRTKRVKTGYQHIPTPSSTHPSSSPSQSTAPPTPTPPRRSTRQAVVGARAKLKGTTSSSDAEEGGGRMKLRSRGAKTNAVTKTTKPTGRTDRPPVTSKATKRSQKATTTTTKPPRGRPRGKPNAKAVKGKGKARPLENVLDLSDNTREKYEKERRERVEYFKRLEGYQIQKENVYII